MKKLLLALSLVITTNAFAQMSCCSKPASTETFAMLTHDKKFINAHLEPLPFTLQNPIGKGISFKTPDGKTGYGYEIKAKKFTTNYVIVIHEWWGLNDYIKQESEKLFKTLGHVNVIAIDLYDKKVATNRDSAGKYLKALKTERATAIIQGVLNYAGADADIATIGWCFGGSWSLQASMLAGARARACVMYYGMPEENEEKLQDLQSPVLFIWPEQDKWINKDVVTKFEATMARAKRSIKVEKYNADHAFANPSNPKYSKEFADDAFNKSISFIKKHLK